MDTDAVSEGVAPADCVTDADAVLDAVIEDDGVGCIRETERRWNRGTPV